MSAFLIAWYGYKGLRVERQNGAGNPSIMGYDWEYNLLVSGLKKSPYIQPFHGIFRWDYNGIIKKHVIFGGSLNIGDLPYQFTIK